MSKQTLVSNEARAALLKGVNAVADPVKVTLGPRGRNVMIDRMGQPIATRDGVTVAKEVSYLKNPFENMGAAYAREVADAAVTEAGDGTTTASVLLQAIVTAGMKLVDEGAEPLLLADGINAAAAACVESIKAQAIPATPELVEQVAIISTHGDIELGKLIAVTAVKTGKHGVVELQESRDHKTTVEHLEGFYFERGVSKQDFINSPGQRCVLKDPYILISERVIVGALQNVPGDHLWNIVDLCVRNRRPLLIIAEDLQGDALNFFTTNIGHGTLSGCFVKLPGVGDSRAAAVRDLMIAVGAKRIHSLASTQLDDQLSSFTLEDLGQCKEAIISPTRTVLIAGAGDKSVIQGRIKELITQSQEATNPFEKQLVDHRIARLTGGVAILRVGAHSEPAMIEKKARAEDAIHACRGAMADGVVPGGGVALLRARETNRSLGTIFDIGGQAGAYDPDGGPYIEGTGPAYEWPDDRKGAELLLNAIMEPALQIIRNAGKDSPEKVVGIILCGEGTTGYDSSKSEHCDMIERGIVDPAKVVMVALSKAASIGALLLTTEVLITDLPEPMQMPMGPGPFRIG